MDYGIQSPRIVAINFMHPVPHIKESNSPPHEYVSALIT